MAKKTAKIKSDTVKANVLKIVPSKPSSPCKNEFIDGFNEDDISFLISRWAKLEDAVKRLEYAVQVIVGDMMTRESNLAAFNSSLKKAFPDWK